MLNIHWPNYSGSVLIIIGECGNKQWTTPFKKILNEHQKRDSRIGDFFEPKSDDKLHYAARQAADLASGIFKDQAREYVSTGILHQAF
jgi:hypothetical protein